ncbi:MAG TPA: patatin-like phospholipase family protein [Myxococcales bacterium]|nr:patatin-like phospholipase family protein [Myxococcales bacterium]
MADAESPLALVLSGGGARGAYEVGVLRYVLGKLAPRLGDFARPRIFSGTSVGAINACALAAHHDVRDFAIGQLAEKWQELGLDQIFRRGWRDLAGLLRWLLGSARPEGPRSLLDAGPLADLVRSVIPWRSLHQGVAERRVLGVTVSATDIETGHTVVFVETEAQALLVSRDRAVDWAAVRLTPQHALASAAIPIIFPAVRVAGRVYSDGSLRQNTPIAPALRLGAGRVLVVGLRSKRGGPAPRAGRQDVEDQQAFSSPLFLFGKLLDALLLDRVENDLANLRQVNAALHELSRVSSALPGPVAAALETAGGGLRPVSDIFIRPSQDLGILAAHILERPSVKARLTGPAGYLLRRLGEAAGRGDPSDVLSYLLFDAEYNAELLELGERDAAARKDELEQFLASPESLPIRESAPA